MGDTYYPRKRTKRKKLSNDFRIWLELRKKATMPKEVQEKLGISDDTFYRSVNKLKDEELTKKQSNGKYVALDPTNPEPMGWQIDEAVEKVVAEILSDLPIAPKYVGNKNSVIKDAVGEVVTKLYNNGLKPKKEHKYLIEAKIRSELTEKHFTGREVGG